MLTTALVVSIHLIFLLTSAKVKSVLQIIKYICYHKLIITDVVVKFVLQTKKK